MPVSTGGVGVDRAGNVERYQPPYVVAIASGAEVSPGPPANPRPGTMWWDGSAFSLWDGVMWHAIGGAGGGVPEPGAVGSFLRTNTGTWVAGLPLAGGTLTPIIDGVSPQGVGLTISNDWTAPAITLNVSDWGTGIQFTCSSGGTGTVYTVPSGCTGVQTTGAGNGLNVNQSAGGSANAAGISTAQVGGTALQVTASGANSTVVRLTSTMANTVVPLDVVALTTTPGFLRLRNDQAAALNGAQLGNIVFGGGNAVVSGVGIGALIYAAATEVWSATANGGQLQFRTTPNGTTTPQTALTIDQDGRLAVGAPTGPAVTGAGNVNIAGSYYINGVQVTLGDPDSGGTGFRCLRVPN